MHIGCLFGFRSWQNTIMTVNTYNYGNVQRVDVNTRCRVCGRGGGVIRNHYPDKTQDVTFYRNHRIKNRTYSGT